MTTTDPWLAFETQTHDLITHRSQDVKLNDDGVSVTDRHDWFVAVKSTDSWVAILTSDALEPVLAERRIHALGADGLAWRFACLGQPRAAVVAAPCAVADLQFLAAHLFPSEVAGRLVDAEPAHLAALLDVLFHEIAEDLPSVLGMLN